MFLYKMTFQTCDIQLASFALIVLFRYKICVSWINQPSMQDFNTDYAQYEESYKKKFFLTRILFKIISIEMLTTTIRS